MSQITDAVAALEAQISKQQTDITAISGQISTLNAQLQSIEATGGTLSAEDAAALTDVQTKAAAVTASLDALVSAIPAPAAGSGGGAS